RVLADARDEYVAHHVLHAAIGTMQRPFEAHRMTDVEISRGSALDVSRTPATRHGGGSSFGVLDLSKHAKPVHAFELRGGHGQLHGRRIGLAVAARFAFGVLDRLFVAVWMHGVAAKRLDTGQRRWVHLLARVLFDLMQGVVTAQSAVLLVADADVTVEVRVEPYIPGFPCHRSLHTLRPRGYESSSR